MKKFATLAALALLILGSTIAGETEQTQKEPRYGCSEELEVCLDWMAEHYANRGWAGMQLDSNDYVFTVTEVHRGSPAAKAKVRPGDVLVAVNGIEFAEENREKLIGMQGEMKPGEKFTYTLKRDGKRHNVECVLVEMPFEVVALQVGMHLFTDHVDLDN